MSDVWAPQPVKTKANGDIVAAIVDSAGTNKATVSAGGAVKVDNSAVTQPVSGTVTANVGTTNGLALDATITGGTQKAIVRGGAKGSTTATDVTSSASGANHQPLDVALYDGSGNQLGISATPVRVDPTGTTTQPVSGTVTSNAGTGTMTVGQATGTNLHAVLDTGSTTAVTQATGTNLHTVVDSGAVTVSQATGTNLHVVVDSGTVTTSGAALSGTVVDDYLTSAALAAGATVTLDSTQIASGTGSLVEASVSSSVALKAQLGTWDGTTYTVKRTFFVDANTLLVYIPQRYDEIQKATGATAKFRWSITNMDNANAADVYASTTYWR